MTNNKTYTQEEFEMGKAEAVLAYDQYNSLKRRYDFLNSNAARHILSESEIPSILSITKEELNNAADNCNKKIPKSLIDKLGIKKIQ